MSHTHHIRMGTSKDLGPKPLQGSEPGGYTVPQIGSHLIFKQHEYNSTK